ncbi:Serine/threonine protein kinase [Parasponia andersonii]|uniref:non-specific serine/threonine protein kinase n=1 Tax=Parasponia andersonii TaxID=3476 RepID=A0A2P5ASP1_PARAD|nr:Serine/threonine protein kinase [Parasponia andersonii]
MRLIQVSSKGRWSCFATHAVVFFLFLCLEANTLKVVVASQAAGNETDRLALLEFKAKITNDPFGVLSSWNESIHFCQWPGIQCGRRHRRVTILDLNALKLSGSISPHVGNLSFLRKLSLYNNTFSHEIPPEIGRLRRLQYLQLFNNSFTGKIPANISGCSNLFFLSLSRNQLVGEIPLELRSLSKFQFISLHANNLTGNIPSWFGNLSFLETVSLSQNSFSGRIPDSLGQLKKLFFLSVSSNNLSGTMPPSFFNLSSIRIIDLGYNQIEGTLPSDLGILLPSLRAFAIGRNQFTGSLPVSLSNASNLEVFTAGSNQLRGKVPGLEKLHMLQTFGVTSNGLGSAGGDDLSFVCSLTNSTRLVELVINDNNFGGALPDCITNLSATLETFALDDNEVYGNIPNGIENLVNLSRLDFWSNHLSGNIPSGIGKLQRLVVLFLGKNFLSGSIPSFIGNLSQMTQLELSDNNFHGRIPSSLGKCKNLLYLDLSKNNLSGAIPPEIIGLSSLSMFLDLSRNHLTGELPDEIGNLKNLGALALYNNMFSGEIPKSLGSCIVLEYLYMHHNFFRGGIPSSFSSLRGIKVLDLSNNNLSGEIPEYLKDFKSLQKLNLSNNYFEGEVPVDGVFKNVTATSVMGNSKLCGGMPGFQLPKCSFKSPNKRKRTIPLKLIISIVSGILGITLLASFLWLHNSRKNRGKAGSGSTLESTLLKVSYQSLLKATDGFSSANLIGEGSFGSVYKGILDQAGKIVAVKVLKLLQHGASKSFMAECKALRNIRHRNLVKVITACAGVDYNNNEFKALVYEFMVNGSIEDWLHPRHITNEMDEAPRNLNFLQRLCIAIDIASALDYLHHQCQPPVVHCDIKPSNILLDNEMTGHISDFGLSKFLPSSETHSSTDQTSSIKLKGTVGYAAPEYGMGSEVSPCGDLYSYGIVLLEMFTGKRPTDNMFKDGFNLRNFVKESLPRRAKEIADPRLFGEFEWESTTSNVILECLIAIFKIGVACSSDLPRERKNMTIVEAELRSVRNKLGHIRDAEENRA